MPKNRKTLTKKPPRPTAASNSKSASKGANGFRVPTVQKLGELLSLFIPQAKNGKIEGSTWKLQDIARRLDWDDATTHRFLISLTEIELLERHTEDEFSVGLLTVELASVYLATKQLRGQLIKRMEELSEFTGLTAHIGVRQGSSMIIIASREGSTPLKARSLLGERVPLHATAGGKAILSLTDDKDIRKICAESFDKLASNTRTHVDDLMKDIQKIRNGEIARADSEFADGLSALAIPIPAGYFGPSPATLSCTGPTVLPANWERAYEQLQTIAEDISHRASLRTQSDAA